MSFEKELAVAKDAARKAGDIMERYRREGFEVERKNAYTDLVTGADRECQEVIVDTIREEFPDDGFLGEEDGLQPDGEERVWVIDPIDGTTNFVHGYPHYCTSIALQEDGESVVGVVYNPARDELFTAVRGDGAALNGEPISVSAVDKMTDAMVVSRLLSYEKAEGMKETELQLLGVLNAIPVSFRRPGAAALDLSYVAAGRFDGHCITATHPWDIAAGSLMVEEAGGTTRVRESVFTGLEIVDSNGKIQDELEEVFDRNVRG